MQQMKEKDMVHKGIHGANGPLKADVRKKGDGIVEEEEPNVTTQADNICDESLPDKRKSSNVGIPKEGKSSNKLLDVDEYYRADELPTSWNRDLDSGSHVLHARKENTKNQLSILQSIS